MLHYSLEKVADVSPLVYLYCEQRMISAAVNSRWEDVGVEPQRAVLVCGATLHKSELEKTDILIFRF